MNSLVEYYHLYDQEKGHKIEKTLVVRFNKDYSKAYIGASRSHPEDAPLNRKIGNKIALERATKEPYILTFKEFQENMLEAVKEYQFDNRYCRDESPWTMTLGITDLIEEVLYNKVLKNFKLIPANLIFAYAYYYHLDGIFKYIK